MNRAISIRLLIVGSFIAALLTGCTRDPNVRKQKFLESGNHYRDQGKLREAAIQYLNALQVDNRFAEAHYQLAETCLKLKNYNCAAEHLSRTLDFAPDNYAARLDLANLLIAYHDLKAAQPHLDILRQQRPDSPDTHLSWAKFYAAQDNIAQALQETKKAIDADPSRSESVLDLAMLQDRDKQPEQAEVSFKKAIDLAPKAMNAQLALGDFYQKRNRLPEAEKQFKHAIDVDPKDPAPIIYYAGVLMAEGKRAEAEAFLKETKKNFPDNSEGYTMLAVFYFANGDFDKALEEYASLYHEHPKEVQVKKNYIEMLIRKQHLDEATKLNDELLKASPKDTDALIYRGQIHLNQGDAAGAVDSLQQALKNDSNNAVAHYHLGLAFDIQRNEAQAESELREAVSLRPDLIDAQLALAALEIRRAEVDALIQTAEQIIKGAPN